MPPSDACLRRSPSSVPSNLRSTDYFAGRPWFGDRGISERVGDIMARGRAEPRYVGPERVSGRDGEDGMTTSERNRS